ncbi:MAG: PLP-dependent transferase [Planctomycetaceae bacterium]
MKFETRAIHTGVHKDQQYNSVTTPIYPTSTFSWNDLHSTSGYDYTRSGNPTRDALCTKIWHRWKGVSAAWPHPPACRRLTADGTFQSR